MPREDLSLVGQGSNSITLLFYLAQGLLRLEKSFTKSKCVWFFLIKLEGLLMLALHPTQQQQEQHWLSVQWRCSGVLFLCNKPFQHLSAVKQQHFHNAHRFCGPGIWTKHSIHSTISEASARET